MQGQFTFFSQYHAGDVRASPVWHDYAYMAVMAKEGIPSQDTASRWNWLSAELRESASGGGSTAGRNSIPGSCCCDLG